MKKYLRFSYFLLLISNFFILSSCEDKKKPEENVAGQKKYVQAPAFNPDSAYQYVKAQVDFGPRVPNTASHVRCGDYLVQTLRNFGAEVIEQPFQAKAYNGTMLRSRNIIGTINPQAKKRILLAAHWDTRPFADKDSVNKNKPIDGANDGASGVGILLEVARTIQESNSKPEVGIDIIYFDSEDYGEPEGYKRTSSNGEFWCLGSQHWAKNKHVPNYSAFYGILLDMTGGKNATFAMEGTSMHFAPSVMEKVWQTGNRIGYGKYFSYAKTSGITDDHSFVNEIAKIPMIDIIQYDPTDDDYFFEHHHTHGDNMSVIDKNTLKAVGQTLLEVLYNEKNAEN